MTSVKSILAASAIATAAMVGSAAAMPAANLDTSSQALSGVQQARWVCGPYRCFWRPNVFIGPGFGWRRPLYGFAGPRWGWGRPGWGWRRRWGWRGW